MTEKKITKKDRYTEMTAIFEGMGREDLAKFCTHELELLAKKNAGKSKVSEKEQALRDAIADAVVVILENATAPLQCKDIVKAMPNGVECNSPQKLTPILKNMVQGGIITKAVVKGASVYSLA
jgi:hypothetical protein